MRPSWLASVVLLSLACGAPAQEGTDLLLPGSEDGGVAVDASPDLTPEDAGNLDFRPPLDGDAVLTGTPGGLGMGLPRLKVTMVDVGQGDGLLVQLPGGHVLAVDGGPSKARYSGALKTMGVRHIDYAVLSHAHADHYTGLTPAIAALMPTDCLNRVFDPGMDRNDVIGYPEFRTVAGCRYQKVGIGQTLDLDAAVEVTVLSAHDMRFGATDDSHGINNTSVVVRLRYGRFSMLFQGDAEQQAEQATFQAFPLLLRSTVLKAGHHGSCTASGNTYLDQVAPQFLLMSMSDGNSYGMPHCQTMGKLKARPKLRWGRTDVNGNITVTTDGEAFAVTLGRGIDSVDTCPRDCASPLDF
jgi:competence protein ComEC